MTGTETGSWAGLGRSKEKVSLRWQWRGHGGWGRARLAPTGCRCGGKRARDGGEGRTSHSVSGRLSASCKTLEARRRAECGRVQDATQNAWRPCFSILVLRAHCPQAPRGGPLPLWASHDRAGLGSEPTNLLPPIGQGSAMRNRTHSSRGFDCILWLTKMSSKPVPDG